MRVANQGFFFLRRPRKEQEVILSCDRLSRTLKALYRNVRFSSELRYLTPEAINNYINTANIYKLRRRKQTLAGFLLKRKLWPSTTNGGVCLTLEFPSRSLQEICVQSPHVCIYKIPKNNLGLKYSKIFYSYLPINSSESSSTIL